jgi:hypothetical protein
MVQWEEEKQIIKDIIVGKCVDGLRSRWRLADVNTGSVTTRERERPTTTVMWE